MSQQGPIVNPVLQARYKNEIFIINFTTITLTLAFIFTGFAKISGIGMPSLHYVMVHDFRQYALILQTEKINMDDTVLRVFVGINEIFMAVSLLTTKALMAGWVLIGITVFTLFMQTLMKRTTWYYSLLLGFLFVMVMMRLKVRKQIRDDAAAEAAEAKRE